METSKLGRRGLLLGVGSAVCATSNAFAVSATPDRSVWERVRFVDNGVKEFGLSDISSQSVLLIVWGSWCAACLSEIKKVEALIAQVNQKRLTTLLVSHPRYWNEDSAWAQKHNVRSQMATLSPYTALEDLQLTLMKDRYVFEVPKNVIYNNVASRVIHVGNAAPDWVRLFRELG